MSRLELLVGDPAPAFPAAVFLKGTPFSAFEPGHVYVVECWATWCGPCLSTIPHLTQMQKDHPDVRFVGVAVWEDDIEAVRAFVTEKGDEMGYAVAFDVGEPAASGGWMPHHWLLPAYQNGIPTAFIVDREGRIAWIGHPAVMKEVLPSVVDGSFDRRAATDRYAAWIRESMTREKSALHAAVQSRLKADDNAGAIQAYDAAIAECPRLESEVGLEKLRLLLRTPDSAALDYGSRLVTTFGSDFPFLKRATASEIVGALEDDTVLHQRQPLARFVIDLIRNLDAEKSEEDAYESCVRARCLAIAFLEDGQPTEALRQAEAAIAHGRTADLHERALEGLQSLVDRCAGSVATHNPKTPTVVCDGDVCRIV
ncbi:UNVERIFIED_ORG: thiol-disulfide isomerase/thioredoxin [Methylobacterium sp. SuP10 SLI 274]|uniref:TlpA family protein disulfide reductase n=1 Tax=Methylorubrum extorquens TaxID=408 RepID=UPI00209DD892|nr:TlpA disulfide reductase family protein [Methylorubrum extorquens]MDF9862432.1 thiol-disulfide isomerase/thioredoxin [Methylorubrum pseudosasae]MDH6636046.1 thiol-disulfide isomerase/thioredoxin [Methylobacterium sp. SuP10 SLI 274]MDH6665220.1 thiol-disulfide isomerase/thioredoxin [Methylorubrum zatmanii]MCP1557147.1 thiol-disulfide isomerase/thioredoxin [Methylorubrum extorquens]MDF9790725.1 thiol-disulfide isomerase/thioredoxin [Methylorubrum extorquens]